MKLSPAERDQLAIAISAAERSGERLHTAWWLITGPPGSGKSTLTRRFAEGGWPTVKDPARAEFEEQLQSGVFPDSVRRNYLNFQKLVLTRSLISMEMAPLRDRVVFDYGIAESLAFMKITSLPWDEMFLHAAARFCFERVFVLDLVPLDPSTPDLIRTESEDTRRVLRDLIEELYEILGHRPMRVPALDPEDRYRWILNQAEGSASRA
jgi:predicted ATPase